MNKTFYVAIIAQSIFLGLYLIHRFLEPLGSDTMFIVFIASLLAGVYLLWQCFRNPNLQGVLKGLAAILGILPFLGLILLIYFVTNFRMH